jgi:hypothetical protein
MAVELYLVPEGEHDTYSRDPFLILPEEVALKKLRLNSRVYSRQGLTFNLEQAKNLNGVREPRVAVAKLDLNAAAVFRVQPGYYALKNSLHEIRLLKSST